MCETDRQLEPLGLGSASSQQIGRIVRPDTPGAGFGSLARAARHGDGRDEAGSQSCFQIWSASRIGRRGSDFTFGFGIGAVSDR